MCACVAYSIALDSSVVAMILWDRPCYTQFSFTFSKATISRYCQGLFVRFSRDDEISVDDETEFRLCSGSLMSQRGICLMITSYTKYSLNQMMTRICCSLLNYCHLMYSYYSFGLTELVDDKPEV